MTDLDAVAQSNVDMIEKCLDTPPDEHLAEQEEEWWFDQLGERPAMYMAQALVGGDWWADLLAWTAWAERRLTRRSPRAESQLRSQAREWRR